MNDPRTDGLERSVNILLSRLAALEAEVARLGQTIWQLTASPGGSGGSGNVQLATGGGIVGKSGGVLGSATYTLQDLDAATGTLTSGPTVTVWNNSPNAISNDIAVGTDTNGNKIAIAEFCP